MPSRRTRSDTWIESLVLALIGALAVAALLSGCLAEKEEVPEAVVVPTWTELTASGGAIAANCSCHSASAVPNLTTGQYSTILAEYGIANPTIRYVVPGDKSTSLLYLATVGGSGVVSVGPGIPMPGGSSAAADIAAWIDGGAPEN
jgi:hypothetical protein